MSLQTLNYSSHIIGYVNNHRIQYKTRVNPAVSLTASSILLGTDESGNLLDSKKSIASNSPSKSNDSTGPLIFQNNTVGIIGGVSIDSTLNFLKKIVRWSPKDGNLMQKRGFLGGSGARCIVMLCHISHSWHGEVSKGCSVPFLHVGECVARELKDVKLKPPQAGSPIRIGVLTTNATLTAGLYLGKTSK